jgi:hypothetical protein
MKKITLLFLFLSLIDTGYSQRILPTGNASERIAKACSMIKIHEPEVYESMVSHSTIQSYEHYTENPLFSTNKIEGNDFWILIGTGSLYERSINRLAGTIFHESLHMLLELQRRRSGKLGGFSQLTESKRNQEEILVYKRTRELLVRLNTTEGELKEYDNWVSFYF